jgi:signal peptidase I
MAKSKQKLARPPVGRKPAETTPPSPAPARETTREYVESLAIAFLLAFLFRTFLAEGYQIPTGSMGPTLMGRHKDLTCVQCGYDYRVGSSQEINQDTGQFIPDQAVTSATCPQCRYSMPVGGNDATGGTPSFSGDRIAVSKVSYDLGPPQRWDVAVFKCPERPRENYIKRVVGIPNERARIYQGDIYTQSTAATQMSIQRKPSNKIWPLLQVVYDNDFALPALQKAGWPARWQTAGSSTWKASEDGKIFQIEQPVDEMAWVQYRHFIPSFTDWQQLTQLMSAGQTWSSAPPRPQLISDFYAFNTAQLARVVRGVDRAAPPDPEHLGLHWVGDLVVECELEVMEPQGEVALSLVEAGRTHTCTIDLATGDATTSVTGNSAPTAKAETSLGRAGTHRVAFGNVDQRLHLWIDGEPIEFDRSTDYEIAGPDVPTESDLTPAAIGARNAQVAVRHLQLYRDVYYIADRSYGDRTVPGDEYLTDYGRNPYLFPRLTADKLVTFMSTPEDWAVFRDRKHADFVLAEDQFLALGDNSPNSHDARFWMDRQTGEPLYWVDRNQMVGQAFYVYWPHAVDVWPRLQIPGSDIRVPFYPNFARMRWIR